MHCHISFPYRQPDNYCEIHDVDRVLATNPSLSRTDRHTVGGFATGRARVKVRLLTSVTQPSQLLINKRHLSFHLSQNSVVSP